MKLIENGADLNRNEKRGNTPLHFCCNNGHMESATLLLIVRIWKDEGLDGWMDGWMRVDE